MKKLFVYLALPIVLSSIQACNNNTSPGNKATDSTTTGNTMVNDSIVNANTDTSKRKNAIHIDSTEVPGAVVAAFNNKYSNVADVKWLKADTKRGKTIYRARWKANGKKMMATFSDNGTFIREKQN